MHILYVDESGDGGSGPGSSRHLVLCGAAMHEGQWRSLTKLLDDIQVRNFPTAGAFLEFHASEMRTGARSFRGLPRPARDQAIREVYEVISRARGLTLFAAVIDKAAFRAKYVGRVEVYRGAFEGLSTMFDFFLKRKQRESNRVGRGIVVFDEARPTLTREIRRLLAEFQASGTRWAPLGCIIETAFFFDSRSSRLMQIADFAAYAVYRWYEHEDGSYLSVMQGKFDHEGRRLHGLKCYPLESTKAYRARS
ncbi:MAG TPA: DUF3800 domain-containing protein [Candidatus Sulfotelmatobacter sp.]